MTRPRALRGLPDGAGQFPDDPALPALAAIRSRGLAAVLQSLGVEDAPVEFVLRGYSSQSRATFEVVSQTRRFALKAYADDPQGEAELYASLAAAGLSGGSDARVPTLLAWDRDLRVVAIEWLAGPTARDLVRSGPGGGRRAGELAARWMRRMASLPVDVGPALRAAELLERARAWITALAAADTTLGTAAAKVAAILARTEPPVRTPRLVHGTLYARHVIDLGNGVGVIDWQRFGQGPLEFDAGTFLATIWRIGLRGDGFAIEAGAAEEAFLASVSGLLDLRVLAWHRALMLLRLASKQPARPTEDERPRLTRPASKFVLQALSETPATQEELDQIRRLLDESKRTPG